MSFTHQESEENLPLIFNWAHCCHRKNTNLDIQKYPIKTTSSDQQEDRLLGPMFTSCLFNVTDGMATQMSLMLVFSKCYDSMFLGTAGKVPKAPWKNETVGPALSLYVKLEKKEIIAPNRYALLAFPPHIWIYYELKTSCFKSYFVTFCWKTCVSCSHTKLGALFYELGYTDHVQTQLSVSWSCLVFARCIIWYEHTSLLSNRLIHWSYDQSLQIYPQKPALGVPQYFSGYWLACLPGRHREPGLQYMWHQGLKPHHPVNHYVKIDVFSETTLAPTKIMHLCGNSNH